MYLKKKLCREHNTVIDELLECAEFTNEEKADFRITKLGHLLKRIIRKGSNACSKAVSALHISHGICQIIQQFIDQPVGMLDKILIINCTPPPSKSCIHKLHGVVSWQLQVNSRTPLSLLIYTLVIWFGRFFGLQLYSRPLNNHILKLLNPIHSKIHGHGENNQFDENNFGGVIL